MCSGQPSGCGDRGVGSRTPAETEIFFFTLDCIIKVFSLGVNILDLTLSFFFSQLESVRSWNGFFLLSVVMFNHSLLSINFAP